MPFARSFTTRAISIVLTMSAIAGSALFASAGASKASECSPNLVGFDVCEQARRLKAEAWPSQRGATWGRGKITGIDAEATTLAFAIAWPLSAAEIDRDVDPSAGVREPLRAQLTKQTKDYVCNDVRSAAMTRLGARYVYRFALPDGRPLQDVIVSECPAP